MKRTAAAYSEKPAPARPADCAAERQGFRAIAGAFRFANDPEPANLAFGGNEHAEAMSDSHKNSPRRAFVSHSTLDDKYVAELEAFLRALGVDDVFNDDSSIKPDEQFWPAIEKGIADRDTLVVVITAASMDSEWVRREVEYARGLSKNIIPLRIEDCSIPSYFDGHRIIEFRVSVRMERRCDISRILTYAPAELIGRETETALLADSWRRVLRNERSRPHVLTFVALGGEGKTSLVANWAAALAHQDWPGCDAAFAWSFYSQGTREQMAASSDLFLKEALTFFGDAADKEFAAGPAGAYEKGQRLARIVGRRRSLLILDGLEPLQYAPTSPTPGQAKDQGIAALLKGLAGDNRGLCVVTTRYSLPDLRAFWQNTAPEVSLLRLSRAAGVHLLQSFDVKGSLLRNIPFDSAREQLNEFEKLVEDVQGHALTLNLLGTYLRDAHAGDIRKGDLVNLEEADTEEQGGHAFRVMEAYEREFEREGDKGQRALAVLRLLGLFDRPITSDCIGALLQAPAVPGLTEPLAGLTEAQRNLALKRLEDARLLAVNRDASGVLVSLDAHPLLREYFARELLAHQPNAWREAHRRIYKHLCANTREGDKPTLEDLQPLYQAVAHGCQAGLLEEARATVFRDRIMRDNDAYSVRKLGAYGSNLGALACFFESPWTRVSIGFSQAARGWILGEAASSLQAVGRLNEAFQPLRLGVEVARDTAVGARTDSFRSHQWKEAAVLMGNLSELELSAGEMTQSLSDAQQSEVYANHSGEAHWITVARAYQATTLHQMGRPSEAEAFFRSAESWQADTQPSYKLLYATLGFRYCEFLLAFAHRTSWQLTITPALVAHDEVALEACHAVYQRAEQTLRESREWGGAALLDIALDQLTLSRVALFQLIQKRLSLDSCGNSVSEAMQNLRRTGEVEFVVAGLLTRAWVRFLTGARTGLESAQADLDEAWEAAERGPMRLHMADIHLHRARLFFR
ncbi:MAG TPA: toll/interleukin-1 receptor domain-containing protein, partial [Chthoniobacteraceae bacterium]|nr:toll/interleukin-1 receptor domain-containing protein [Chthoniobacteraceae bacterium]